MKKILITALLMVASINLYAKTCDQLSQDEEKLLKAVYNVPTCIIDTLSETIDNLDNDELYALRVEQCQNEGINAVLNFVEKYKIGYTCSHEDQLIEVTSEHHKGYYSYIENIKQ